MSIALTPIASARRRNIGQDWQRDWLVENSFWKWWRVFNGDPHLLYFTQIGCLAVFRGICINCLTWENFPYCKQLVWAHMSWCSRKREHLQEILLTKREDWLILQVMEVKNYFTHILGTFYRDFCNIGDILWRMSKEVVRRYFLQSFLILAEMTVPFLFRSSEAGSNYWKMSLLEEGGLLVVALLTKLKGRLLVSSLMIKHMSSFSKLLIGLALAVWTKVYI